jgi:helicase MOV-10
MHITSKHHREGSSNSQVVSCPLCNVNVYGGPAGWNQHLTVKRHKKNVRASTAPLAVEPQSGITTAHAQFCDFCQTTVLSIHWNNHVNTNKHKSKKNYVKYRSAVEDAEKDKNGVAIIGAFDLGFVEPDVAKAGKKVSASITTTQLSHTKLVKIQLASSLGSNAKQSA